MSTVVASTLPVIEAGVVAPIVFALAMAVLAPGVVVPTVVA